MATVATKTISRFRNEIFTDTGSPAVTAITRSGKFMGVMITSGELPKAVADRLLQSIVHNPEHTVSELTRKAIS